MARQLPLVLILVAVVLSGQSLAMAQQERKVFRIGRCIGGSSPIISSLGGVRPAARRIGLWRRQGGTIPS
jgi:hypothetical protein